MLEKMFKLKENNTTAKTEVIAGITTFMTMAYILAVNPNLLSQAGMDPTAVLIATCLASFIGTFAMALLANYPFALAPGMGLNAYFAFTVCGNMGYSWKVALMAVFFEGIIFIILSLTNVREAIFNAIPTTLKKGVSAGIGLFIAFIGLQGGHIVVNNDSTLLSYVNFRDNWHTEGICAVLALIGLLLTAILYIKKVKGSILIGILATWILGMICQAAGVYRIDADAGFYSLYPAFAMTDFSKIGETFGQCFTADFHGVGIMNFIVVMLSFLFVDMFDGRCNCYFCRCGPWYVYNYNIRRELCRCRSWCKNRSCIHRYRIIIPACNFLCTNLYGNSGLCNSTGADLCRIPDGIRNCKG